LTTQQKRKGDFNYSKVAPKGISNTKRSSRKTIKKTSKFNTTKKKTINNTIKKEGGFDSPEATLKERSSTKVG
jgi:hypothetical protein